MLANNDVCGICGHEGAKTADHIIGAPEWRARHGSLKGFDDPANLQPAHGTMGNVAINPCPVCGRLCNQSKGANRVVVVEVTPHSRDW